MKKYALIGENISYSKSPEIHKAFYEYTGINAEYGLIDIPADEFEDAALNLWVFDGFNVTKPYKEKIIPYLTDCGLSSVNTVTVTDGRLYGHNTDSIGFGYSVRDIDFANKNVLLLGAGGAAKAIAQEVVNRGGILAVHNRTAERAAKLIESLGSGRLMDKDILPEIIINATTVGQTADEMCIPEFVDTSRTEFFYDTIYRKTPMLKFAEENGRLYKDGYEMLVYQAIASECIFNKMELTDVLSDGIFKILKSGGSGYENSDN